MTEGSFVRNWSTSKGAAYVERFDEIFKTRTNRPGYTKIVYGSNGQKKEFPDADKRGVREMGLTLKVTGIV